MDARVFESVRESDLGTNLPILLVDTSLSRAPARARARERTRGIRILAEFCNESPQTDQARIYFSPGEPRMKSLVLLEFWRCLSQFCKRVWLTMRVRSRLRARARVDPHDEPMGSGDADHIFLRLKRGPYQAAPWQIFPF